MTRALVLSCLAFIPLACTAQTPTPASPAAPVEKPVAGEVAPSSEPTPQEVAPSAPAPQKITYTACNVDGKYIAMTYDDGPHATLTPRLLDMLKERGIKATFFVVGKNVAEYPKIAKRIVDEGHEIASHSWSHPLLSKLSDASVRDQLERTHAAIEKATGVNTTLLRPPYGGFTERQRRWAHGEFGYKTILWDLDPLDWKVRNANHVEREILQNTRAGSIILTHDIHKSTVDAMPGTLDALLARGFKFATVSELIAMDRPVPKKPKATPKPKTVPAGAEPATEEKEPTIPTDATAPEASPATGPAPKVEETKTRTAPPAPAAAPRATRAGTNVR